MPIPLPQEPSPNWKLYRNSILSGSPVPLPVLLRLKPGEVEFYFGLMFLKQHDRKIKHLRKLEKQVGKEAAGMAVKEADEIRNEAIHNLSNRIAGEHDKTSEYRSMIYQAIDKGFID